jgi:hypothetical protein
MGTEAAPIVVRAAPGARPVLVGAAGEDVLELGGSYFTLRGLELRGGDRGVRLTSVDHATIEDLKIHDVGDIGISCNQPAARCAFVTLRRNEIFATGKTGAATGEGIALGCDAAACGFRDALIEGNYIHDLGGTRGGGIEIQPGATNTVLRDNVVVRTKTPGIGIHGYTAGGTPNVVERNLVWITVGDGIQLVGHARVRNNVVLGAGGSGIHSRAAGGHMPTDLQIVNNTVVDAGTACLRAGDWAGAADQVIANNALYCEAGAALDLAGGAPDAHLVANIGRGTSNAAAGFVPGRSLTEDLSAPGSGDVYPREGSPLENAGNGSIAPNSDFDGCARRGSRSEVGAYERTSIGMRVWPADEGFKPVASCDVAAPDGGGGGDGGNMPPGDGGCCETGGGSAISSSVPAALVLLAIRRRRRAGAAPRAS